MPLGSLTLRRLASGAVALAVGLVAAGVSAAEQGRLTEPPIDGVDRLPAATVDAEVREVFQQPPPRALNPLEGVDGPVPPELLTPPVREAPPGVILVPIPDPKVPAPRVVPLQVLGPVVQPVDAAQFRRRVFIVQPIRAGPVIRGRNAWITSILRTTDPELARTNLQKRLDDWLDVLTKAFELSDEQRTKLRLAGQGDISRYLEECQLLVSEALALEDRMAAGETASTDAKWSEASDLRDRYVSGLHGRGSLFRKTWDAVCGDPRIDPAGAEGMFPRGRGDGLNFW